VTINSFPKLIADCERLLAEVEAHAAELPHAEDFQRDLEAHLKELKAVKARQKRHREGYRQASTDLRHWMTAGQHAASRLRSLVQAEWGRNDERLLKFGILPRRKLGPRKLWALRKRQAPPKPNGSEQPM
jgi:hypothetical protein